MRNGALKLWTTIYTYTLSAERLFAWRLFTLKQLTTSVHKIGKRYKQMKEKTIYGTRAGA